MGTASALPLLALGAAITADVAGTFVIQRAEVDRDRRSWVAAAALFLASLASFAVALEHIPTSVAEALFVALGSAAVAAVGVRRGERLTARKVLALAVLSLGVVVLQAGVGDV